MREYDCREVERVAVVLGRDERRRAVVLVANDAPGEVLARELTALEVEGVAVAVVRWSAEHGDAAVVVEPAELAVVRDVAPHEVPALRAPRRALRPQRAGPEPQDRRVALAKTVERRVDGDDVGIDVGDGRRTGAVVARRVRDHAARLAERRWRLGSRDDRRERRSAGKRARGTEEASTGDVRGVHGCLPPVLGESQARCFLKNAIVRSQASFADGSW